MKRPNPLPPRKDGDKIEPARWYYGEKFQYEEQLKTKGKVTMYFKTVQGRYAGNRIIHRYWKVYESGLMVYVDMTLFKTGVAQGLSVPHKMLGSNKREFDKMMKIYKTLTEL